MKRTQIYITQEQDRLLSERAADASVSKAEVIRRLLDQGLGLDDGAESRRDAIPASAGAAPDEADWADWLGQVRGRSASERLSDLGT